MPFSDPKRDKEWRAEWREKNREKLRARDRDEDRKAYRRRYWLRNKQELLRKRRLWNQKRKRKVLEYYGGYPPKCSCCNEDEFAFLTIDHIYGKGNEHRRKLKAFGSRFYHWLIKHGYPKGYQVLCMNCNHAKGIHGKCPHEKHKAKKSFLE